ncbi:sterol glucosyltransferase [Phlyctema vagabunda]|uniref:Sterol glucosyltransferase n=1 Tax=Phlyctema vagabunda TaxID=108571 RepID=A0ABR4PYN0_9HELO
MTIAVIKTANSSRKMLASIPKGVIVDIPLNVAKGMRAVPRLYNAEVKEHAKVTNFKSGAVVAGSTFTYQQGGLEFTTGLGKGLTSFAMKTGAATIGLIAYPSKSMYKSIRSVVMTKTRTSIEKAQYKD